MLTTLVSWRHLLAVILVGALSAAPAGVTATPAAARVPAPTHITIDAISSGTAAPIGTPPAAWPSVLAVAGQHLVVTVSFFDAAHSPAYFTKDTRLVVTSDHGPVTNIDTVAQRGEYTSTLIVSMPSPTNRVALTVAVAGGKVVPGTSGEAQRFDVLSQLRLAKSTAGFRQGIGGDLDCATATPAAPVCGIVILPQGASSPDVLLSLGPCDDTAYSGCGDARGSIVQTIVGLDGYTRTSPATVLIKCDKTVCGGGAIHTKQLSYTRFGNAPLTTAEDCPAKGTVGLGQLACVDYVQSRRDGSGDTHLYFLFVKDARISVG